jgi:hypothetical protein
VIWRGCVVIVRVGGVAYLKLAHITQCTRTSLCNFFLNRFVSDSLILKIPSLCSPSYHTKRYHLPRLHIPSYLSLLSSSTHSFSLSFPTQKVNYYISRLILNYFIACINLPIDPLYSVHGTPAESGTHYCCDEGWWGRRGRGRGRRVNPPFSPRLNYERHAKGM